MSTNILEFRKVNYLPEHIQHFPSSQEKESYLVRVKSEYKMITSSEQMNNENELRIKRMSNIKVKCNQRIEVENGECDVAVFFSALLVALFPSLRL